MPISPPPAVKLHKAQEADLPCIENMMQFYIYDLSQWYPNELNANGLYNLRPKVEYWGSPCVTPFLIRANENLAGFAVVDNEIVHPESTYNLGYFFVARRYRQQGIGTTAFASLLRHCPGAWEVYHLAQNASAARFWPGVFEKTGVNRQAELIRLMMRTVGAGLQ